MNPSLNPIDHLRQASDFLKQEKKLLVFFWALFSGVSLFSFWYRQGMSEQEAQMVQVVFELMLVFFNVFFLHSLNLKKQGITFSGGKIVGEGVLLTFGFFLQTVFWFLATLVGSLLLLIPGLMALVVFYLAPMLAVIYPDYRGKIFFLSKELFWPRFLQTLILIVVFGGIVPFFPSLIHLGLTGQMESSASYLLIPISSFLYLYCEGCLFEYAYSLVEDHRKKTA